MDFSFDCGVVNNSVCIKGAEIYIPLTLKKDLCLDWLNYMDLKPQFLGNTENHRVFHIPVVFDPSEIYYYFYYICE